ncbi:hypothetical protein Aph02nite_32750 [Actinoplanes philippinensis]|nr:hypothetical protein Aph02nite_32750 [Actinoplanes philippinensis]
MALSPDAYVGLSATLTLVILLSALTAALAADRDHSQREAAVVTAARWAHQRRGQLVDSLSLEAATGLPAVVGCLALQLRALLAEVAAEAEALRTRAGTRFSAEQHALLETVQTNVRRIRELNDKLVAYAVADSVALRPGHVDLTALAAEVAAGRNGSSTGPAPRIAIADLPAVHGDATLLRQVFDNLIGYAIDRAVPGRPARVSIRAVPADGPTCRIEVVDNGVGVPPGGSAELGRTRGGLRELTGFDLGLALVHRVVRRHGGTVGLEADPGHGSLVWFTLPTPCAGSVGCDADTG